MGIPFAKQSSPSQQSNYSLNLCGTLKEKPPSQAQETSFIYPNFNVHGKQTTSTCAWQILEERQLFVNYCKTKSLSRKWGSAHKGTKWCRELTSSFPLHLQEGGRTLTLWSFSNIVLFFMFFAMKHFCQTSWIIFFHHSVTIYAKYHIQFAVLNLVVMYMHAVGLGGLCLLCCFFSSYIP